MVRRDVTCPRFRRSAFESPCRATFDSLIKHPALFTALAQPLARIFPLFAVVRHPLAALASWQSVKLPVNEGRMPVAEAFSPELRKNLAGISDCLGRRSLWFDGCSIAIAACPNRKSCNANQSCALRMPRLKFSRGRGFLLLISLKSSRPDADIPASTSLLSPKRCWQLSLTSSRFIQILPIACWFIWIAPVVKT